MQNEVILTCAVTGAGDTTGKSAHVPVTPKDIAKAAIDAAKAGKHVYCEKGLTRTFDEAVDVYDVVKETGITFQLGHQNRQVEANEKAKQIYRQGLLGPVNLVEIATNRNSPWGAWVWNIPVSYTHLTLPTNREV